MAREFSKPIPAIKHRTVSFKISGWSVAHQKGSLLNVLADFGHLTAFTHYPQLNTSYANVRSGKALVDLPKSISRVFPKVRVETEQSATQEVEKSLETPELTAFISSGTFFSETELFSLLKQFGRLRALSFSHSTKYKKWYCKASFYEKYSLEQLIRSGTGKIRTLGNGVTIKIVAFKKTVGQTYQDELVHSGPSFLHKVKREINWVVDQKQQNPGLHSKQVAQASTEVIDAPKLERVSKSCSRGRIQRLPQVGMFKSTDQYIENVLRILKSQANEKITFTSQVVRSKSSTKNSQIGERNYEIPILVKKGKTQLFNSSSQVCKLSLKELLFLQIGQSFGHLKHVNNPNNQTKLNSEDEKEENSYLSQSDVSIGYTAVEKVTSRSPVLGTSKLTPKSEHSGNKSALVLLTKHSSDAEQSLAASVADNSNGPSGSRFETLFGSRGGQFNTGGFHLPLWGCPNTSSTSNAINFFAFPCS